MHHGWGTWWDYDGGGNCFGVTGWGAHSYDQVNRALGTDDTGPVSLLLEEPVADRPSGKFAPRKTVGGAVLGDTGDIDTGTDYYHMARLTGPRAKTTLTFANGTNLQLHLDGDRGPGPGGDLHRRERQDRDQPQQACQQSQGDRPQQGAIPVPTAGKETAYHIENWIECIKSRKPATRTSRSAIGPTRSAAW